MFDNLSERLSASLRAMAGKSRLTEDNIRETLREVRMALLEADVALSVVRDFTDRVKERAVGTEVSASLSPGQEFLKVVQAELQAVMGDANERLNLSAQPPAVVMVAGLQGAGKTTSVAKLARYLMEREKKKVTVVSADVYRPAAIKQLETLANEVGARFEASSVEEKPVDIVNRALKNAKTAFSDVLLVDTAGRLAIDSDMMAEIGALHAAINPVETLFVIDAMTGQDAVNTATAFDRALPLTGVILTKVDADTRGGAALSVRSVTGKPIKFMRRGRASISCQPSTAMSGAGMHNSEGVNVDLYIPRKCSATNRLIQAKDKASVQMNIGHVNADGVYTGDFTPVALCGFLRAMGEADGNVDRLWVKCWEESKAAGSEI